MGRKTKDKSLFDELEYRKRIEKLKKEVDKYLRARQKTKVVNSFNKA